MVESIYGRNPLKNNENTDPKRFICKICIFFLEKILFSHKSLGSRWGHWCAYKRGPSTEGTIQKWKQSIKEQ